MSRRPALAPLALVALACLAAAAAAAPEDPPVPADAEVVTLPSGLRYSVLAPGGEGAKPRLGDRVRVHYTGWLTDGKVFDSSRRSGRPAEFVVGEVIPGWNEALQLMAPGARWKLTIPYALAYGEAGNPPAIPPKATLVFDVELLAVIRLPEFRPGNPAAQQRTGSGLVYEVVKEGAGDPPGPDDGFEVLFALWNASGKLLESSEGGQGPLVATPSQVPVKFLAEAVRLLRPGARYRFEVPPELAFGARGMGRDLPPNSTTVWELELVRVNKPLPVPPFALSDPAKVVTLPSGLKIETLAEGSGPSPKLGQTVEVHYAGWLTDGTLFDASYPRGAPAAFQLGRVIPGWNEGLQHMKVGGRARLTIPGSLAYGAPGKPPKIPPNATLVFVVELLGIK